MKWKYTCPHCSSVLNPNVKIILRVRRGRRTGLMLLSPRPGNYKSICDPDFSRQIRDGQLVEFSCPACGAELTSPAAHRLAELRLVVGKERKRIQFSRVYGEHATFVLDGESVVPYGPDAPIYDDVNFFGV